MAVSGENSVALDNQTSEAGRTGISELQELPAANPSGRWTAAARDSIRLFGFQQGLIVASRSQLGRPA